MRAHALWLCFAALPFVFAGQNGCSSSSTSGDIPPIVETGGYHGGDGGYGGDPGTAGDSSAGGSSDGTAGSSATGGTGGMPVYPVAMRSLPVKDTEPNATDWLDDHLVFVRTPQPIKQRLLVHLARTGGHPGDSTQYLTAAAESGYLVLSLSYPNTAVLTELCGTDSGCFGDVRKEILQGVDASPKITIGRADSVENRITKALVALNKQFPDESWDALLQPVSSGAGGAGGAGGAAGASSGGAGSAGSDKEPRWASITLSGHAFGAGEAAYAATVHTLEQVTMVNGPDDPADGWLAQPRATPANRFYAFAHTAAPTAKGIFDAWAVIGCDVLPSVVDVDTNGPPFSFAHTITTSRAPGSGGDADLIDSVITDAATPHRDDGTLLYDNAWHAIAAPYLRALDRKWTQNPKPLTAK